MRAKEFIKSLFEGKQKGTYAGVHFSDNTKKAIAEYIKDNDIPNATPTDKLHSTLLYSRKYCPDYEPQGELDVPLNGTFTKFDVWEGQPDDKGHKPNCLVMEFDCPELTARHKKLMEEHNATYDFPDYKTHITFSYDIGEMDMTQLPEFDTTIEVTEEYGEDLDLDWAQNNTKDLTEDKLSIEDVIARFKAEHPDKIKRGCTRNQCHRTAGAFTAFAKSHGYTARSVIGSFVVDNPEFDEWDFYDEEIVAMRDEGFDPDSLEDRTKYAHKHDMVDELKKVPHHWNEYKGKIIDFTANAQFVQTGLAADTNKARYSKHQ